ncbi:hypothetical protein HK102_013596 [Quaeritorhiza haematococci]|nr:hypothetical protein HK102_013596 [Quaeritorhiza haematococci]
MHINLLHILAVTTALAVPLSAQPADDLKNVQFARPLIGQKISPLTNKLPFEYNERGFKGSLVFSTKENAVALHSIPGLTNINCTNPTQLVLTFAERAPTQLPWTLPVNALVSRYFPGCGSTENLPPAGERPEAKNATLPGLFNVTGVTSSIGKTLVLRSVRKQVGKVLDGFSWHFEVTTGGSGGNGTGNGNNTRIGKRQTDRSYSVNINYDPATRRALYPDLNLLSSLTGSGADLVAQGRIGAVCRNCFATYTATITFDGEFGFWSRWASVRLVSSGAANVSLDLNSDVQGSWPFVNQLDYMASPYFPVRIPYLEGILSFDIATALGIFGELSSSGRGTARFGAALTVRPFEISYSTKTNTIVTKGNDVIFDRIGPTFTGSASLSATLRWLPALKFAVTALSRFSLFEARFGDAPELRATASTFNPPRSSDACQASFGLASRRQYFYRLNSNPVEYSPKDAQPSNLFNACLVSVPRGVNNFGLSKNAFQIIR